MKKLLATVLVMQVCSLILVTNTFSQCGTVANDLSMTLPCVEFDGSYFKLNARFYTNPNDPSGLYWQFDSLETAQAGVSCAKVTAGLKITAPCVYFNGINLTIVLEQHTNPVDPNGLYWKLKVPIDINPVTITGISGDTSPCIDPADYTDPEFIASLQESMTCLMQCNNDPNCLVECMPDLGMGSAFTLAFTFDNPGTVAVDFTLAAGSYYKPQDSEVQPMLVAVDQTITLEPGVTTMCIPTYCMDGMAHSPSDTDIYSVADITQSPCLLELLEILRGKGEISHEDSGLIQDAVWTCTETGSITSQQRTALENI